MKVSDESAERLFSKCAPYVFGSILRRGLIFQFFDKETRRKCGTVFSEGTFSIAIERSLKFCRNLRTLIPHIR